MCQLLLKNHHLLLSIGIHCATKSVQSNINAMQSCQLEKLVIFCIHLLRPDITELNTYECFLRPCI